MAGNLNQAFLRAYAKDRQSSASGRPSDDSAQESAGALPHQPNHAPVNSPINSAPTSSIPNSTIPAPHSRRNEVAQPPISAAANEVASAGRRAVQSDAAQAASVWQRLDSAAQAVQAPHYLQSKPNSAERVSAGVSSAPPHRRAHAAEPMPQVRDYTPHEFAGPDSSIPGFFDTMNPSSYEQVHQAHAPRVQPRSPEQLPLRSDAPSPTMETPAAVEARRRTVADFLYAAGNVPPTHLGRSAMQSQRASVESASMSMASGARMPAESMPATSGSMDEGFDLGYAANASQSPAQTLMSSRTETARPGRGGSMEPIPSAQPGYPPYAPVPHPERTSGRILRVDVPQAAREAARQEEIERNASIAMGFVQSESQSRSGESLPNESMRNESMRSDTMRGESAHAAPHPKAAPQVDYDRLRTAAAISAREEKLRHQVHKPFNPVWEVDNLQWPTVCNKLMEQRAESLAQVGAHLKAACQDGLGIMAVTSPSAGEGRTTVTCCLGLLAASHGLKTVVIDLDLDNPTLCMQTNLEVEHDWRDTLTEDISLEEAAVHSINDQLTIMPLKPRQGRPSLMASDRRMSDMLRELSGSFDLVIVDTSRMKSSGSVVAGLADAKIFDAAVVVVDRRNTDSSRIDETVRAIQQSGIESIGIVDNFAF